MATSLHQLCCSTDFLVPISFVASLKIRSQALATDFGHFGGHGTCRKETLLASSRP
jgi:hypothetical protein